MTTPVLFYFWYGQRNLQLTPVLEGRNAYPRSVILAKAGLRRRTDDRRFSLVASSIVYLFREW